MELRKWEDLPKRMRTDAVRPYYDILVKKQKSLAAKRVFDVTVASILFLILLPVMIALSVAITLDSKGGPFFLQERVTTYGKTFKIVKFRTMVKGADKKGTAVTVSGDMRVTKIGKTLRKYRLDELPQLINIIVGDMSFVGTRPEVVKYVNKYSPEMYATFLLPAGVTSKASIEYKDEEKLISEAADADKVYVEEVLPEKMKYNLESIRKFSFWGEIGTMVKTVIAVLK